jgi:hypothetical protein
MSLKKALRPFRNLDRKYNFFPKTEWIRIGFLFIVVIGDLTVMCRGACASAPNSHDPQMTLPPDQATLYIRCGLPPLLIPRATHVTTATRPDGNHGCEEKRLYCTLLIDREYEYL